MNLFPFQKQKKPLVVLIHGFGRKSSDELKPFSEYLNSHGFDTVLFDYFRSDNPQDIDEKVWFSRCEDKLKEALSTGRDVILAGFSMGGVIASRLASIYPVKALLLAAPAFYPYDLKSVSNHAAKKMGSSRSDSPMSSEQTSAFMRMVSSSRNSIAFVDCPVLIVHGTEDEIISPKSSEKAFAQIPHENKHLIYLYGAKHRFLYEGVYEKPAFEIARSFLEGNILPF